MKAFIAIIFISITVLSVIRPVNPSCDVSTDSVQLSSEASLVACTIKADSSFPHSSSSGHDHDICHTCHLGHCSFTLASSPVLPSYGDTKIFSPLENVFELSDFEASLFRPPIS